MEKVLLLKKFNRKLADILSPDLPILTEIKQFVIESGGKRIRPFLHYYYSRIIEAQSDEWQDVGAIGELIHAASLLHDDVIDSGDLRRGKPTINRIYNNKTAILSGDYLFASALNHLTTLEKATELLPIFTNVIQKLSEGELLQMQWENESDLSAENYERIIYGKTGVLFGAMTEAAAVQAGEEEGARNNHRLFGERMGRIFQIRDDYLDYYGDVSTNGKELFQDFERGLVTRPVILLRTILDSAGRARLNELWQSGELRKTPDGISEWKHLSEKEELKERLQSEIASEIESLLEHIALYTESKYSGELRVRLQELAVG